MTLAGRGHQLVGHLNPKCVRCGGTLMQIVGRVCGEPFTRTEGAGEAMKRLELTEAVRDALALIDRAALVYVPGRDSASIIELPKLALADAVLAAVAAQRNTRAGKLPTRAMAVPVVVEVTLQRKRRHRA